jgi:hypothetical protein
MMRGLHQRIPTAGAVDRIFYGDLRQAAFKALRLN